MTPATNGQVQSFSDSTLRPFAEQFRAAYAAATSLTASSAAAVANVAATSPDSTFADSRTDVPNVATPQAIGDSIAFAAAFAAFCVADARFAELMALCVRPLSAN